MRPEQRDSYRFEFHARVLEVREGGRWVSLENGYFYPTSGGQPHDTGRIGDARVIDVRIERGVVWHRLEGTAPEAGAELACAVDADRRYHHMQRHSAQHLLSQAFVRIDPTLATRSVSLRGPDCTVDLAGAPGTGSLARAERLVNEYGYRALPITSFEVDESRLGEYPLRRPAKVAGAVRLVAMGDVEVSACGGTHLANTGEALPIKLTGSERIRGGLLRVTFRAGWEALEDYELKHSVSDDIVRRLSAPLPELPERVVALQEQLARAQAALERELHHRAEAAADALLARAAAAGDRAVRAVVEPALLEPLRDNLQGRSGVVALLAAAEPERGRLAFCAGPGTEVDVRPALRAALAVLGGRGGGRPERAQGAGPAVDAVEAALDAALDALRVGR